MSMIAESTQQMIKTDYAQCASFSEQILEYETVRDGTQRQEILHTCFKNCKDYNYDEYKDIFYFDNRKNCSDVDSAGL